jgi:hypothetical protein
VVAIRALQGGGRSESDGAGQKSGAGEKFWFHDEFDEAAWGLFKGAAVAKGFFCM